MHRSDVQSKLDYFRMCLDLVTSYLDYTSPAISPVRYLFIEFYSGASIADKPANRANLEYINLVRCCLGIPCVRIDNMSSLVRVRVSSSSLVMGRVVDGATAVRQIRSDDSEYAVWILACRGGNIDQQS